MVRQPSEVMVLVVNRPKSKRFLHLVNKRCGVVVILSLFLLVVLVKLGIIFVFY